MGWVEDLHGKTVGLDTAPLIYYIEQNQAALSEKNKDPRELVSCGE